jgi:hypothetical protein
LRVIEYMAAASSHKLRAAILPFATAFAMFSCTQSREVEIPAGVNAMNALEERLLNAEAVRVVFHVTAEGIIQANLRGEFLLADYQEIHLGGEGQLGSQPVHFLAQTDEGLLHFGPADNQFSMREPSDLKAALMIGFTRMGILHNAARLTGGAPPDQTEGGVQEWVTLSNVIQDASAATIMFEISVAGEPTGSASLALDDEGLPLTRRQIVHFPGGEMRVTERYSDVVIVP